MSGDSLMVELPLFQGEGDGSNPILPLHFVIRKINHETAENWVVRWHYSKLMPTGQNICFGLYANQLLYSVIVYGIGVNPYQAQFLKANNVIEIKRLCRSEPRIEAYPLSKFISITSKLLRKEYPCDCMVAFADPQHGHSGGVYKASGFILHGKTNAEWHCKEQDGTIRHRRFAFRHARRNGKHISESRGELGLQRVQTPPKFRWIKRFK